MNEKYRAHPIQIIFNIWKLLIFLLLPLLRGLMNALTGSLITWLEGAWFDLTIVFFILTLGLIQWYCTTYQVDQEGIYIERGVIIRKKSFISKKNILSSVIIHSFYLRPLKAVKLRVDTLGGSYKKADFNIILKKDKAEMFNRIINAPSDPYKVLYRSNLIYVIALSLISSNSLMGIILITTFISNLGSALGKELSERIYDTFHQLAQKLAFGIPPAAANAAFFIFIGWFVMFVRNILKYRNLTVSKASDLVDIKSGLFTVSQYKIYARSINYFDIRQTLLTKILHISSLFVHAVGFGKDEDDVSAFVPAVRNKNLHDVIGNLELKLSTGPRQIKANITAVSRFVRGPVCFCILIPLITLILVKVYPDWHDFLISIATIPMIPAVWFFTVRLIDCFTSGISKDGDCYTLKYSRGFYFHTIVIPEDKITSVRTRQSIFQRVDGRCDVFVYTCSEGVSMHRCRSLFKEDVLKIFDKSK